MLTEAELRERLKAAAACLAEFESLKKQRGWRNKVDPLLLDYEDYRKTRLWKTIKSRVLERDQNRCKRCSGSADVVHHLSYDAPVMRGEDDSKLAALCSGCHEIVHFTTTGQRRDAESLLLALTDLSLNEPLPKVDLRTSAQRLPIWRRLTAVQKIEWTSMYNARKLQRK